MSSDDIYATHWRKANLISYWHIMHFLPNMRLTNCSSSWCWMMSQILGFNVMVFIGYFSLQLFHEKLCSLQGYAFQWGSRFKIKQVLLWLFVVLCWGAHFYNYLATSLFCWHLFYFISPQEDRLSMYCELVTCCILNLVKWALRTPFWEHIFTLRSFQFSGNLFCWFSSKMDLITHITAWGDYAFKRHLWTDFWAAMNMIMWNYDTSLLGSTFHVNLMLRSAFERASRLKDRQWVMQIWASCLVRPP